MALIKCSECSKEISEHAVACPHCGAPVSIAATPRVRTKKRGLGWWWLLVVPASLIGLLFFIGLVQSLLPKSPPPPIIKASMGVLGSSVIITNREDSDLTDCLLRINDNYLLWHINITKGREAIFDTSDFRDNFGDGKTFRIADQAVNSITVECKSARGSVAGVRTLNR